MTDVTIHCLVATSIMAASIVVVMFVVMAMSVMAMSVMAGAYSDVVPWREMLVVVRKGSSGRPQILVVGGGMWAAIDR